MSNLTNEGSSIPVQQIMEMFSRPLRFGYIVDRDVTYAVIEQLFQYNSSLWGGVFNLFVPTDGEAIREDWWQFLLHHDPDVIYFVGEIKQELLEKVWIELQPLQAFTWDDGALKNIQGEADKVNPVLVISLFRKFFNQSEKVGLPIAEYPLTQNAYLRPFIQTTFGVYDPSSKYVDTYHQVFKSSDVEYDPPTLASYLEMLSHLDDKLTPIKLTGYELSFSISPFGLGHPLLIVSDGFIDDIFLYFILRQNYSRNLHASTILLIPYSYLEDEQNIETLVNWYRTKAGGSPLIISSQSLDLNALRSLRTRLKTVAKKQGKEWCIDIQTANFTPNMPTVSNNKREQIVTRQEGVFSFQTPMPDIIEWIEEHRRWATEIKLSTRFNNDKGFGLMPSMFRTLNMHLSGYPNIQFVTGLGSQLRIARGQLALPSTKKNYFSRFRFPTNYQFIKAACDDAGYSIQSSRQAYYDGIVRLLGGIKGIAYLKNFKILKFLSNRQVMAGNAKTLIEICRLVEGDDTEVYEWVKTLSSKQILLRGYNLSCPVCETTTWYELHSVSEHIACQACLSHFQTPVDARFAYRLNLLFADRKNQGTFAVLFTLFLLHKTSEYGLIWQADVKLKSEKETELDIIAMCDGGLTVVEAKNSFKIDQDGKIDELIEQLSRSIRVAEDIKAKLYLFATLQESIPQKVIDFINRQNDMQDHLRIRVVTKNELLEGRLYEEGYPEERPVMVHDLFKPLASYQGEDWIEKDSDCGLDRRWNILTS